MKRIGYIFLWTLFGLTGHSQDSLFFRNKGVLVVLLREVSPTEITYQRVDLPDGPVFVIPKKEVERIRYKNGLVEVIKVTPDSASSLSVSANPIPSYQQIRYRDAKLPYRQLVELVDDHPNPSIRNQLYEQAAEIYRFKRAAKGMRTGAIITGGLAIGGALVLGTVDLFSSSSEEALRVPPIVLGICAVGFMAASISFEIRIREKRKNFVDLYND